MFSRRGNLNFDDFCESFQIDFKLSIMMAPAPGWISWITEVHFGLETSRGTTQTNPVPLVLLVPN
jgi:hypothetical protein